MTARELERGQHHGLADLAVRMTIPFAVDEYVGAPALTFSRWLPLRDEDAITAVAEGTSVKLWFDLECTRWVEPLSEEELACHVNVLAYRVNADALVRNVRSDLLDFATSAGWRLVDELTKTAVADSLEDIASRILLHTLTTLNRLVEYARNARGQYWLREYAIEDIHPASFFRMCDAKACLGGADWVDFRPRRLSPIRVRVPSADRYIQEEEWPAIQRYVDASGRPPLAKSLLSGAEALAAAGHRRSALTEAVTAMEIALYAFASSPDMDEAFGPTLRERLDLESLRSQVEHMGLSGSLRYLLPVVLTESQLPRTVLSDCQDAIGQRQNVVHQGQRDIAERVLQKYLTAIRSLCESLERLTLQTKKAQSDTNSDNPSIGSG